MRTLTIVRNCAFLVLVALTTFAFEERLLAAMGDSLKAACQSWEDGDGWDCDHCARAQGFPPDWEANGSCDFSSLDPEDVLQYSADYCQDISDGFFYTCADEYPEYLVGYYQWSMPDTDPCYEAMTEEWCWITWADASCDAGENSTWSGQCSRFNMCECE